MAYATGCIDESGAAASDMSVVVMCWLRVVAAGLMDLRDFGGGVGWR